MSEESLPVMPPVPAASGFDSGRMQVSLLFPEESLQHLSREDAARCQALLGHGEVCGVWETSEAMIGDRHLADHAKRVRLRDRINAFIPEDIETSAELDILLDEGTLQLTRYALLLRLAPCGMRHGKGRPLDATVVLNRVYSEVPPILARAIIRKLAVVNPAATGLLGHLTAEDVTEFQKVRSRRNELDRMRMMMEMGLWYDVPPKNDITRTTNPKGERETPSPVEDSSEYQPIPDDYLESMGPRILWVVEELGPNLIHLLEAIPELLAGSARHGKQVQGRNVVGSTTGAMIRLANYFEQNVWRDSNGDPLAAPCFPLKIGDAYGFAKNCNVYEWPPRTLAHVHNLSVTLQAAHLWIALLAMAGRDSEVQTLKRDCVSWDRNCKQFVKGKTYKLSPLLAGEERDWPAPEALVLALGQQRRLVEAWERIAPVWPKKTKRRDFTVIEGDHLWASLGRSGNGVNEPLVDSTAALMQLARRVGLTDRPGDINLHAHRFRKTTARLVAIAAVDSPRILKKLLGHKDIAMTLHYILADKAIQAEILKVENELRIMRAKGLIEDIHASLQNPGSTPYGGHGGGAMPRLTKMVAEYEQELHRQGKEWDAEDAYELARVMTINGRYWRITAPGVICLKPAARKSGPCTCDSSCENRVEDETARRDVLEVIEVLIDHGRRALAENDLILLSRTVTDLDRDLQRFGDIAAQYSNHHDIRSFREALV